jgi:hypothetical protein
VEEFTILFATRAEYEQWIEAHPMGSEVQCSVCGEQKTGVVSQVAMDYGKVWIRLVR